MEDVVAVFFKGLTRFNKTRHLATLVDDTGGGGVEVYLGGH